MNPLSTALIVYTLLVLSAVRSISQEMADSIRYEQMQREIEELNTRLDSLERKLQESSSSMFTKTDVEDIFKSINEDKQEFTDSDRRSKRKALDSLFRAAVKRPGELTFTGQFMGVFHWDATTEDPLYAAVGTLDLFAISTFGKGGLAFINLQGVGGNGPAFGSFHGFHAGAGTTRSGDGLDRLNILEAWAEYGVGSSTITAGKVDLTNYFDPNSVANDEYSQFLANGFVNNTAFAAPRNGPGLVLNVNFLKEFSVILGAASSQYGNNDLFDNVFSVAQIGRRFKFNDEEVGAIRVFGYHQSAIRDGWGYGVSADLKIIDKLYGYGRFGKNMDSLAVNFGVLDAYSVGLQWRNHQIFRNLLFTSGFAYGQTEGVGENIGATREEAMEAYLRFRIRKAFFISPHYQVVRSGVGVTNNNISMLALRMRLSF